MTETISVTRVQESTLPTLPWMKHAEFPVVRPEAFDSAAYDSDWYDATEADGHLGGGRPGPLGDVTRSLKFALQVVRDQFDIVVEAGAHQSIAAADLAQVIAQAGQLQRAAEAVAISATAGYARREPHDDVADREEGVESIRARGFAHEWAPQELGHLMRLSTRTASTRVELAAAMASRFPRTLEAVRDGAIEAWQARTGLDLLAEANVDDATAREVDAYIGPRLATTDPTRILALVRYALGRIRPDLLPERAAKARQERLIERWELKPGLTEITARMPSEKAAAIWSAASTLAEDYLRGDPTLTMDQARLDAFVDLALANVTVRTTVTLGMPVVTSAYARTGEAPVQPRDCEAPAPGAAASGGDGVSEERDSDTDTDANADTSTDTNSNADTNTDTNTDTNIDTNTDTNTDAGYRGPGVAPHRVPEWAAHPQAAPASFTPPSGCRPGERQWWLSGVHLPGIGYVPPDVVQSLITTFGTTISTALLDSQRGTLLSYIHQGYRPTTAIKELVRLRDGRCRSFGCTIVAMRCDQDHATPYDCSQSNGGDGPTCADNLAGLCRRHHQAKQRREWCYVLDPDTAVAWWVNARTGSMRTTVPDISIGCLDPPGSGGWDRHPPPDHSDDRDRVNGAPTGDAAARPPEPTRPGDTLAPAMTLATRRRKIADPTDLPPF